MNLQSFAIKVGKCVIGIIERVSGILETVPVMPESINSTYDPHGPYVNLDLTNMLFQLKIDFAVTVSTRQCSMIRFECRKLHSTNKRAERISSQLKECQQRRKILDNEKCSTVILNFQDITFILLFRFANGRRNFLDRTFIDRERIEKK